MTTLQRPPAAVASPASPSSGRIPTNPEFFREFPLNLGLKLLAPHDVAATVEQRDRYVAFTQVGDPLADAVVASFADLPPGAGFGMIERALTEGVDAMPDATPELIAFFRAVETEPYWLDRGRLDHAARTIGRTGIWGTVLALPALGLNAGYLASRADKVLLATNRLAAPKMAPRRLAETAQWWLDVTTPGMLEPGGLGWASVIRVRLTHAIVRDHMRRRPDWDFDAWDVPLNQSQMAGTLMLFALGNVVGCQVLGIRTTRRERRAVYHLWRYVGHLIGIDPALLPADEDDFWRLLWLQADYEFLPDADSRLLSESLLGSMDQVFGIKSARRAKALRHYVCAYSRLLLGPSCSDHLGIPHRRGYMALIGATAVVNTVRELVRRVVPGATRRAERIGQQRRQQIVSRMTAANGNDPHYRPNPA